MKLKRILSAGLLAGALTITPAAALTLAVDGVMLPQAVPLFMEAGTTYVPLRATAERLGDVTVSWSSGQASVSGSGLTLTARPGETWIQANDRCFYVPGGVRNVAGSVMVPVRALAAAMGGSVIWDAASRAVEVRAGSGTPQAPEYSEDELYWLSRIISAESQGEPLEGKLAVGTVVLGRVDSEAFPDTIYDVIFDTKWGVQFTPVSNGTVYQEPTAESVLAAKLCLEGARAAEGSLYFLDPTQTSNHWTIDNRTYITTIGCHQFYA